MFPAITNPINPMTSKAILNKLHAIDNTVDHVVDFKHTGVGMEERIDEMDVLVAESADQFYSLINHILWRLGSVKNKTADTETTKKSLELVRDRVNLESMPEYVISFEYLFEFTSSKHYVVTLRSSHSNETISVTKVSL